VDEQEAIELLNEIDTTWRDTFDTPWEALEGLGVNTKELRSGAYEELNFEQ